MFLRNTRHGVNGSCINGCDCVAVYSNVGGKVRQSWRKSGSSWQRSHWHRRLHWHHTLFIRSDTTYVSHEYSCNYFGQKPCLAWRLMRLVACVGGVWQFTSDDWQVSYMYCIPFYIEHGKVSVCRYVLMSVTVGVASSVANEFLHWKSCEREEFPSLNCRLLIFIRI